MPLDSFSYDSATKEHPAEPGALKQIYNGFADELSRQKGALSQLVTGRDDHEPDDHEPTMRNPSFEETFGKLAAQALPLAFGIAAARTGLGKILSQGMLEENALLQRTALGFSATEAGVASFATGTLLSTSDNKTAKSLPGLIADRLEIGAIDGLFAAGFVAAGSHISKSVSSAFEFEDMRSIASYASAGALVGLGKTETMFEVYLHRPASGAERMRSVLDVAHRWFIGNGCSSNIKAK